MRPALGRGDTTVTLGRRVGLPRIVYAAVADDRVRRPEDRVGVDEQQLALSPMKPRRRSARSSPGAALRRGRARVAASRRNRSLVSARAECECTGQLVTSSARVPA